MRANESETFVCASCEERTAAENARILLLQGWELIALRRVEGHRAALCPRCQRRARPAASHHPAHHA